MGRYVPLIFAAAILLYVLAMVFGWFGKEGKRIKTFFLMTVAFGILLYVSAILSRLAFGDAGLFIGKFLVVGALFAGLYVAYEKLREGQQRMEEKLDARLKEKDETN